MRMFIDLLRIFGRIIVFVGVAHLAAGLLGADDAYPRLVSSVMIGAGSALGWDFAKEGWIE